MKYVSFQGNAHHKLIQPISLLTDFQKFLTWTRAYELNVLGDRVDQSDLKPKMLYTSIYNLFV